MKRLRISLSLSKTLLVEVYSSADNVELHGHLYTHMFINSKIFSSVYLFIYENILFNFDIFYYLQ